MNKQPILLVMKKAIPMLLFYLFFAIILRLWVPIKKSFMGASVNWPAEFANIEYTRMLIFAVLVSVYVGYRELKRQQAREEITQPEN